MNIVETHENMRIFRVRENPFPQTESLAKDDLPFSMVIEGVTFVASGSIEREKLRERLSIADTRRFRRLLEALEALHALELAGKEIFVSFGSRETTYSEDLTFPEGNTFQDLNAFMRSLDPQPGNGSGPGFRR